MFPSKYVGTRFIASSRRNRGSRRGGRGVGGGGALVAARRAHLVIHPCIPARSPHSRAATRAPTPHPPHSRPYAIHAAFE